MCEDAIKAANFLSNNSKKESEDETAEQQIHTLISGSASKAAAATASYSVVTPPGSVSSSSSVAELQEFCFPENLDLVSALRHHHPPSPRLLEDCCCDENYSISDLQTISREARPDLMELTVSRTGRELQRWTTVNGSETPNCRMTTGCVPILSNGRILLVSSSKSSDTFVLPKGGWEQDESMPLSALRETLEEAGVTGLLGPPLETLTFETKKAAKRRQSKEKDLHDTNNNTGSSSSCSSQDNNSKDPTTDDVAKKRSSHHTHNRMTLFPLYVQSVYDHWPEESRMRRVVTIEEALILLQHRPEFAKMLHHQ